MSNIKLVYITCKDAKEASYIAKKLIQSKLVACSNIISNVSSFYKWRGKLSQSKESILLAKTTKVKKKKIIDMVLANHSYSNPCVIFFDIETSTKLFTNWINNCLK